MNILLTGATGFIGSHTAEYLLRQGHQLRCLVRPSSDLTYLRSLGPGLHFLSGDFQQPDTLRLAVEGVDAVIHCAGLIKARHSHDFFATNTIATHALLNTVQQHAPNIQRFVLVSSLSSCGAALNQPSPAKEPLTLQPISVYGQSKYQAEKIAHSFSAHLPITIIRPSVVYGPRDQSMLTLFKAIQRGFLPLSHRGQGAASTIYVTDVAAALAKAVTTSVPSGSAYFLEDGMTLTWRQRCEQMAAQITPSKRAKVIPLTDSVLKTIAWLVESYSGLTRRVAFISRDKVNELIQPYWVCSSAKARLELAWQPETDWATGTQLTYHWYQTAGWTRP